MVSCDKVIRASVSAILTRHHLFVLYVTSLRGLDDVFVVCAYITSD